MEAQRATREGVADSRVVVGLVAELETPDRMEYTFLPVTAGSILFKVQAANDAHVALTSGPNETGPLYEVSGGAGRGFERRRSRVSPIRCNSVHFVFQIFIGGWGNAKSAIRKNKEKPEVAIVDTPGILSASEPRGFWMRWNHGDLTVGKEGQAQPFLSWKDPEPFGIGHYGICTGWGAKGNWYIEGKLQRNASHQGAVRAWRVGIPLGAWG